MKGQKYARWMFWHWTANPVPPVSQGWALQGKSEAFFHLFHAHKLKDTLHTNVNTSEYTLTSFHFKVCVWYYLQSSPYNLEDLTSIALISFITSPSSF